MKPAHLGLILFIDLLWALNTVALKEAVMLVPPLLSVAIRYGIVLVACLPWMRWEAERMPMLLGIGLVAGALNFGAGSTAFAVADNVSALAIANQLGVPFSLLLAIIFFRERIRWKRATGVVLAFAGVGVLAFDPHIADERLGLLLTALGSFFWAVGNLGFRRLIGIHVLNIYGWLSLVSVPALLLMSWFLEPGALATLGSIPPTALGWIGFSAIGGTLIGHVGMAWLLQRYPVSVITPLTLLTPLLSVVIASIVYPVPATWEMVVGGLLTLAGVAIIALRTAKVREVEA